MGYFVQNKRMIGEIIFLVVVFAVMLWSVFYGRDLALLLDSLYSFNPVFLIPCIACMLVFVMGESVIINYLMKMAGQKVKLTHCFLYSFVGFFFSAITPSASGGQPMQVLAMYRDGISVAVSTIVLALVTIAYKSVLVVLGALVLIFQPAIVMVYLEDVMWIVYLGMTLNVVFIAVIILLVFCPEFVKRAYGWLLGFINKIHPFKHPERHYARMERFTTQYEGTAAFYRGHLRIIFNVFVMTVIQRFILFFITWFTYVGFSLGVDHFFEITILQGMISVAVDMLPLPGGMVVSENMFLVIFEPLFGGPLVLPAMVISRGISYYVQVVVCGIMTAVAMFVLKRDKSTGTKS